MRFSFQFPVFSFRYRPTPLSPCPLAGPPSRPYCAPLLGLQRVTEGWASACSIEYASLPGRDITRARHQEKTSKIAPVFNSFRKVW